MNVLQHVSKFFERIIFHQINGYVKDKQEDLEKIIAHNPA